MTDSSTDKVPTTTLRNLECYASHDVAEFSLRASTVEAERRSGVAVYKVLAGAKCFGCRAAEIECSYWRCRVGGLPFRVSVVLWWSDGSAMCTSASREGINL